MVEKRRIDKFPGMCSDIRPRRYRMHKHRLRLVSAICLVAYLFANTHVNLAMGESFRSSIHPEFLPSTDENDSHSKCSQCAKQHNLETQTAPADPNPFQPCSGDPCDSDCPCCPHGPFDDSCPCPDGCAMCNVAKAPCLTPSVFFPLQSACVGESSVEAPTLHVPPFCEGVMRPPRV